ncbi:MAG: hypothetical protein FWH21_08400 [Kiritimatiellaeota bacterium]|nr:hypothetical protein [Kiritimatiellota bacterium]
MWRNKKFHGTLSVADAWGKPHAPVTGRTHGSAPTTVPARGQAPATESGGKPPHSRGCAFSACARGLSAVEVNTP